MRKPIPPIPKCLLLCSLAIIAIFSICISIAFRHEIAMTWSISSIRHSPEKLFEYAQNFKSDEVFVGEIIDRALMISTVRGFLVKRIWLNLVETLRQKAIESKLVNIAIVGLFFQERGESEFETFLGFHMMVGDHDVRSSHRVELSEYYVYRQMLSCYQISHEVLDLVDDQSEQRYTFEIDEVLPAYARFYEGKIGDNSDLILNSCQRSGHTGRQGCVAILCSESRLH